METGGWNYAKRPLRVVVEDAERLTRGFKLPWSAPLVVQVFEGEAATAYGECMLADCWRATRDNYPYCRPICERAVEARLRRLGTGATSPDGPTYFDQPSDLTPDRFGVDWTEDAPRPMVLTPWNMRGKL